MNTTALVDVYDGAVVERYMYDPYGKPTVLHGVRDVDGTDTSEDEWDPRDAADSFQNRILYSGYYFDDESGLYSVRNRYYHPTLGRWLSRDPIGYADGMSLYEYCWSGPLGATDATGLRPMGPQDPGYQPGFEKLPWKDVPETEKKCPCPCGGDKFIPPWEPEQEPGAGVVPGGGAWSWEGGLKDYGNPRAKDLDSLVDYYIAAAGEGVLSSDYVSPYRDREYSSASEAYWAGFNEGFAAGLKSGIWTLANAFTLGQNDYAREMKAEAWGQTMSGETWVQDVTEWSSAISAGAGYLAGGALVAEAVTGTAFATMSVTQAGTLTVGSLNAAGDVLVTYGAGVPAASYMWLQQNPETAQFISGFSVGCYEGYSNDTVITGGTPYFEHGRMWGQAAGAVGPAIPVMFGGKN